MLVRSWQLILSLLRRRVRLSSDSCQSSASVSQAVGRIFGEELYGHAGCSSDELCDELLCHMLECESCLDPVVSACPVYRNFQALLRLKGSAAQPALYAV